MKLDKIIENLFSFNFKKIWNFCTFLEIIILSRYKITEIKRDKLFNLFFGSILKTNSNVVGLKVPNHKRSKMSFSQNLS